MIAALGLLVGGAIFVLVPLRQAEADATGTIAGQVTASPAKMRAGVVVHIVKAAGSFRPPARPVTIDQRGMKFVPHVLAVVRGTTVKFQNSDNVRHNVFSPDGSRYDLGTWPQGESRTHAFSEAGVYRQLCNVHPEMSGFIVVLQNPYFAVTGADGQYSIAGVPPGSYTIRAWSERLRAVTQPVTVTAGATTNLQMELAR
jgi:plastocyanin